ncbi:hypothetical protein DY000_02041003 [Brassica cretica]|uniref:ABC transporter domain-containing protein n=1 Tax=Brassica cretica TaxID=69181 RepID=A0ABQ7BE25_BRACR|nr:hypothetical protein DY000_02041003 [Brassica cretica]
MDANIFATSFAVNSSDLLPTLANNILGSPIAADKHNYADPGLAPGLPIYSIQPLCSANSTWPFSLEKIQTDVNNELFKGSYRGNPAGITNEIAAAYDLMSTDKKNFNVTIWYNSTYKDEFSTGPVKLVRVPRSINLISNAYLKFLKGPGLRILCEFVKEVPKHATRLNTDIASLLGPLFFTWVVLLLFPVILTSLVYEKQERLRIMMKMHGLVIGLKYFRLNSYSIQFVFYFIYLNLQMAIRFLVSSNILKVVAYILVYGTGLLGSFLFQTMLENQSFPEEWIFALELYPGFSLYRGLYEFSQYASRGNGMKWQDLSDSGMGEVLCIMSIEWFLALIIAFYIDQVFSSGKHPFFFLNPFKKSSSIPSKRTVQRVDSKKVSIDMGKIDVSQEREKVQQLRNEVVAYILVYGTGLLGSFLFQTMLENQSFPEEWIFALELYPGFSLYRGLYEFSQYASRGNGMKWQDLSDSGMGEVLCIMSIEWFLALIIAFYIDQVFSSGKHPFFFLNPFKKSSSIPSKRTVQRVDSKKVSIDMGKIDVSQEREKVQQLRNEGSAGHAILCDNLKKVYPGECFGMLGPDGAGKTSFISMMTGLLKPSSGTALVQGLDICKEMNKLALGDTNRNLLFYGRLKNIKGSALTQAVEESLKSVSLFDGGVGDKLAGNYSGGMKRRLSVAISLIGNPKVVYLDEPSTGLDPASRKNLWDVIQRAKQNTAIILTIYLDEPSTGLDPASRKNLWDVIQRAKQNTAIILTTHSMEEAEFLCDRLGIFVDGALQCIGNSKELNSRYGGSYVFTMTTSLEHEEDVERLVSTVSPNVKKVYHLAGTQKFELPKQEVRIAEVFWAVEKAKSNFTVFAWGLADTTLEDVFIKVAKSAQAFISLS